MHSIFVLARMSFIGSEFTTTSLYSTELLHCLSWVEEFLLLVLFLRFLCPNIVMKANIQYVHNCNEETRIP